MKLNVHSTYNWIAKTVVCKRVGSESCGEAGVRKECWILGFLYIIHFHLTVL